jgi:hypothetical protein
MPIVSADIKYRLSGGASNSDQNASLGGVKSSNEASASLFDNVSSAEAVSGDTEYRCFYVHNASATNTMLDTKVWIQANTPSGDTELRIGLGTSALNATEQTVASEGNAPSGVTFVLAADEANAISLGDIPVGQHRAVWIRRVVNAAAAAFADSATLRVKCDTLP